VPSSPVAKAVIAGLITGLAAIITAVTNLGPNFDLRQLLLTIAAAIVTTLAVYFVPNKSAPAG